VKTNVIKLGLVAPLLVIALATGLSTGDPARTAAAVDFRILLQQHFELLDQGKVAAVMDTFSDDAVVAGGRSCRPAPCVGKAAIQQEIESRVNNGATQRIVSLQEHTAGKGSGTLRITERGFPACNVESILVLFDVEVKNDKIARFDSRPDLSDPQTARWVACISAPPPASISPPRAGDGGLKR
jgi:hypothetical protein